MLFVRSSLSFGISHCECQGFVSLPQRPFRWRKYYLINKELIKATYKRTTNQLSASIRHKRAPIKGISINHLNLFLSTANTLRDLYGQALHSHSLILIPFTQRFYFSVKSSSFMYDTLNLNSAQSNPLHLISYLMTSSCGSTFGFVQTAVRKIHTGKIHKKHKSEGHVKHNKMAWPRSHPARSEMKCLYQWARVDLERNVWPRNTSSGTNAHTAHSHRLNRRPLPI